MATPAPSAPLVTLVVLSFNQRRFAREAIAGALSQSYSPLEIVLSDNASTDGSFDEIQAAVADYRGPHRIVLNRNDENLGICGHVNRVVKLATGTIVAFTGGDDVSLPHRVAQAVRVMQDHPDVQCVSCELEIVRSRESTMPPRAAAPPTDRVSFHSLGEMLENFRFHVNGASRVFRKDVFDAFGPLMRECPVEDGPVFLRSLLRGKGALLADVGVRYRVHGDNAYASARRYQMDYDAIHAQYLRDVPIAIERGWIDEANATALLAILRRRNRWNNLRRRFYGSSGRVSRLFRFLTEVAPSAAPTRADKLRYLKHALLLQYESDI